VPHLLAAKLLSLELHCVALPHGVFTHVDLFHDAISVAEVSVGNSGRANTGLIYSL